MKKFILIGLIVGMILISGCNQQKDPIVKESTIQVKLIDAFSGQVIPNADVQIYSDNGIRCVTTPCNTEGQEWTGKSDNKGLVLIPSKIINDVTTISATGYESGTDLSKADKIASKYWAIELDPDTKMDNYERRLQIIDAQTQKPLSNTPLWVIRTQDCRPQGCSDYCFEGTTNDLGNVYYPITSSAGNKCLDASIFAKTNNASDLKDYDDYWIYAKGYKPVKFDDRAALEKE